MIWEIVCAYIHDQGHIFPNLVIWRTSDLDVALLDDVDPKSCSVVTIAVRLHQ